LHAMAVPLQVTPANVQFCWMVHLDWFKPAQGRTLPTHAPHVHPRAAQLLWVVTEEQAEGAPLHDAVLPASTPPPASGCTMPPEELEASGPWPPPPDSGPPPVPSLPASSEAGSP
jgi:hypothetical protein